MREGDWVHLEDDVVVYRGHAIGSCVRSLTAARLGENPEPPYKAVRAAMDVSAGMEDRGLQLYTEATGHSVLWRQKTVELPLDIPLFDKQVQKVIVRSHIDGLDQQLDCIVEVKWLSEANWEAFASDSWEGLGYLARKYMWQGACQGYAAGRTVRWFMGNKGAEPGSDKEFLITNLLAPVTLVPMDDIISKLQIIEMGADMDTLPPCDDVCKPGAPFSHVHMFEKKFDVHTGEEGAELRSLLEKDWELGAAIEELQTTRDEIRDRVKQEYGPGNHVAGPFTARIDHVKGTARIDTKRLRRELPEIADEYTIEGAPQVRLTVHKSGG